MNIANLQSGTPDGPRVVVSADTNRFVAGHARPTLHYALSFAVGAEPQVAGHGQARASGDVATVPAFVLRRHVLAPWPRAWPWRNSCDGPFGVIDPQVVRSAGKRSN